MKINYLFVIAVAVIMAGCANKRTNSIDSFNQTASVSANDSLLVNPLEWKVICSEIDKNAKTMSTLYGNDIAASYARAGGHEHYPAGSQLSLVTWRQKEDGHWFGGNIPDSIQMIENVNFELPGQKASYAMYRGSPLRKDTNAGDEFATGRIAYISFRKASVIP